MLYDIQNCHFMCLVTHEEFNTHDHVAFSRQLHKVSVLLAELSRGGNGGPEKLSGFAKGYPANQEGTGTQHTAIGGQLAAGLKLYCLLI